MRNIVSHRETKLPVLSSVSRALALLDSFSAEEPELSLSELARRSGTHKSSAFRLLSTLETRGFVEKVPSGRGYRLGWKLVELAGRLLARRGLRELAAPLMEELAEDSGEIVHLSVLDGGEILYLDKRGRSQPLTVSTSIGGRSPAHASAMGKVLLAGLPAGEAGRLLGGRPLRRFTPTTITDRRQLERELEAIRRQGYAVDNEETFPGIRCVAAPLRDRAGRVVAALSVTAPTQRMGARRQAEIRQWVTDTAARISERIRASGISA
jgi:DNA-binding IclR family transcriptional regulator